MTNTVTDPLNKLTNSTADNLADKLNDKQSIIKTTERWVQEVIVGLDLCPFANREVKRNSIRYQVVSESKLEACLEALALEFELLSGDPSTETSLIIFSSALSDFDSYLDFLELSEDLLIDLKHEGTFQLASFHPDYCFNGAKQDDAANYSNRSPYPMLHILREASLEQAIENHPAAEAIPERNIEHCRSIGLEKMREKLSGCFTTKNQ